MSDTQVAAAAPATAVPSYPAILAPQRRILGLTMKGEADEDGDIGMIAVGCVARNRWKHPRWWGHDVLSVCLRHSDSGIYQFDAWMPGTADRARILAIGENDPALLHVEALAAAIIAGTQADITHGADSYANLAVAHPSWARDTHKLTARIGRHSFFRLEI